MGLSKESARRLLLRRGSAIASAVVTLSMTAGFASAQAVAPSRVTPTTLATPAGPSGAIIVASPAGLTPPETLRTSRRHLDVTVEAGFPELEAETAAIAAKIRAQRVTVTEIFAAANAIEQAYAAHGMCWFASRAAAAA